MLLASKFVIFGIKRHRLLHHNTKCIISKHRFVCNNKFSPTLLSLNAVCECATVIGIACWANAFDRKWNGWHRKTITHEIYSHICRTTTRWRRITNRKWRKKKKTIKSVDIRVSTTTPTMMARIDEVQPEKPKTTLWADYYYSYTRMLLYYC